VRSRMRRLGRLPARAATPAREPGVSGDRRASMAQHLALLAVLIFCLVIPSNWTQDIPARYGRRHPGLHHWWLYPLLSTAPPVTSP
jgi:hypothetical protein